MAEDLSSSMTELEVVPGYLVSKLEGRPVAYNAVLTSSLRLVLQLHTILSYS
jgi:hypothetical protein